ncbi:sigma 54-interacting transcriptional regulator [Telmatobacter sp. DSM 110680]|uniref:Sigma 54-interacting transcriptional regulator n=1 Tax=Telmatobacter sp. DSM 110680 TaxID=3036704 RepID=A0AAU7DE25_9BACT
MPAQTYNETRLPELPQPEFIFGATSGMREIRAKIERAAHDNLPVLIQGESGTGKEILCRFLHENQGCGDKPFLKLNCGATLASLAEGEIFGIEKTKAMKGQENKGGLINFASGGTLFLDEIDCMDVSLQRKVAHTLESGRYRQIDGREDLAVDARFVCATSIDMEVELRNRVVDELLGCFVHRVRLLPLRDRREDIPQLCEYLLAKFASEFGRPVPHLSSRAVEAFQQWKWPGNIRELENWVARIVIFGAEEVVGLEFRRQLASGENTVAKYHHVSRPRSAGMRRPRSHR